MPYPGDGPPSSNDEGAPLFGPQSTRRPRASDDDGGSCCDVSEENRPCVTACCCIWTFIFFIMLANSFDVVKPTEYGLMQNGWTGFVYSDKDDVYGAGRHFLGLRNFFITFPAYRVSLEFSKAHNNSAPPVPARTGKDQSDPDSGGQPVSLSFSFQYQFRQGDIGKVYQEFGDQYETRYLLFARMAVSDVAQQYTPNKFWTDREAISKRMFEVLKTSLRQNGNCDVVGFQLLQVDFPDKYEQMITDIQLQVQYKLTSEYQQQVTNVMKDIDVLTAKTAGTVATINANALATSHLLVNDARTKGFYAQQQAKALAYADIQQKLGLSTKELLDYVKIRALTEGRNSQSTVFGTPEPAMVYS